MSSGGPSGSGSISSWCENLSKNASCIFLKSLGALGSCSYRYCTSIDSHTVTVPDLQIMHHQSNPVGFRCQKVHQQHHATCVGNLRNAMLLICLYEDPHARLRQKSEARVLMFLTNVDCVNLYLSKTHQKFRLWHG